jgi:hypothetical protein
VRYTAPGGGDLGGEQSMTSLAALLLATPLFGFSLQAPSVQPLIDPALYGALVADLQVTTPALIAGAEEEGDADQGEASDEAKSDEASDDSSGDHKDAKSAEEAEYRAQVKKRNSIAKLHRPFGIATWAAMTFTVAAGFIQYYNLYGFFADQGSNPCVQGDAIFGQGQCTGTPWIHGAAAGVTTVLYGTTFALSLMMPDPDDLAHTKGEFASRLRTHKILRWVHLGGMIAQIVLGIALANDITGLDRANDYGTLQALATVHMATGLITLGALTWAGALMTF